MHGGRSPLGPLLLLLLITSAALFLSADSRVTGEVVTSDGPVEGARVRFQGDAAHAETDAAGRFSLVGPNLGRNRVTAWAEGFFIAGAPATTSPLSLTLRPLPSEDCERYEWVDPTPDSARPMNCGNCHGEIYREWANSGHARSATNRRFLNLFDGSDWKGRPEQGWSLLADHPNGAGVCTACHAPTVPFTDPAYFDLREARGVGALGVHCDYCHKVSGIAGDIGLTHGRFGLKLLRPAEGQLFFGPLDDVARDEDAHLPLYRQSRYCAPCHEGTVFGVHVYSTYSEWFESPARRQGQQCQSCHMSPTGQMHNIAPGHGGIDRDPRTLANHGFFAESRDAMLQNCLRLSLEGHRDGDGIDLAVVVEAGNVGHAVPTGFVDRHLVLHLEAVDAAGLVLEPLEGPRLPATVGRALVGQPGKLYAKLLKDFDGQSPAPFWRADPEAEDTRLRPGEPDRLRFRFPPQAALFRARLLYRRFWPQVAEEKGWGGNESVVKEVSCHLRPGVDR